jgi:hypothetical protein
LCDHEVRVRVREIYSILYTLYILYILYPIYSQQVGVAIGTMLAATAVVS